MAKARDFNSEGGIQKSQAKAAGPQQEQLDPNSKMSPEEAKRAREETAADLKEHYEEHYEDTQSHPDWEYAGHQQGEWYEEGEEIHEYYEEEEQEYSNEEYLGQRSFPIAQNVPPKPPHQPGTA